MPFTEYFARCADLFWSRSPTKRSYDEIDSPEAQKSDARIRLNKEGAASCVRRTGCSPSFAIQVEYSFANESSQAMPGSFDGEELALLEDQASDHESEHTSGSTESAHTTAKSASLNKSTKESTVQGEHPNRPKLTPRSRACAKHAGGSPSVARTPGQSPTGSDDDGIHYMSGGLTGLPCDSGSSTHSNPELSDDLSEVNNFPTPIKRRHTPNKGKKRSSQEKNIRTERTTDKVTKRYYPGTKVIVTSNKPSRSIFGPSPTFQELSQNPRIKSIYKDRERFARITRELEKSDAHLRLQRRDSKHQVQSSASEQSNLTADEATISKNICDTSHVVIAPKSIATVVNAVEKVANVLQENMVQSITRIEHGPIARLSERVALIENRSITALDERIKCTESVAMAIYNGLNTLERAVNDNAPTRKLTEQVDNLAKSVQGFSAIQEKMVDRLASLTEDETKAAETHPMRAPGFTASAPLSKAQMPAPAREPENPDARDQNPFLNATNAVPKENTHKEKPLLLPPVNLDGKFKAISAPVQQPTYQTPQHNPIEGGPVVEHNSFSNINPFQTQAVPNPQPNGTFGCKPVENTTDLFLKQFQQQEQSSMTNGFSQSVRASYPVAMEIDSTSSLAPASQNVFAENDYGYQQTIPSQMAPMSQNGFASNVLDYQHTIPGQMSAAQAPGSTFGHEQTSQSQLPFLQQNPSLTSIDTTTYGKLSKRNHKKKGKRGSLEQELDDILKKARKSQPASASQQIKFAVPEKQNQQDKFASPAKHKQQDRFANPVSQRQHERYPDFRSQGQRGRYPDPASQGPRERYPDPIKEIERLANEARQKRQQTALAWEQEQQQKYGDPWAQSQQAEDSSDEPYSPPQDVREFENFSPPRGPRNFEPLPGTYQPNDNFIPPPRNFQPPPKAKSVKQKWAENAAKEKENDLRLLQKMKEELRQTLNHKRGELQQNSIKLKENGQQRLQELKPSKGEIQQNGSKMKETIRQYPCMFFKANRCKWGDSCLFSHDIAGASIVDHAPHTSTGRNPPAIPYLPEPDQHGNGPPHPPIRRVRY